MRRTICKTQGRARAIGPRPRAMSAMAAVDSLPELTDQPCGLVVAPSSLQTTWSTSDTMNKSCEKRPEQRVKRGDL